MSSSHEQQPAVERLLDPGVRAWLPMDRMLQGVEDVSDTFPMGFRASLRGIVQFGTSEHDQLYIFDRGEHPAEAAFAGTHDVADLPIEADKRFVVMTPYALKDAEEAYDKNTPIARQFGWRAIAPGTQFEIGRDPDIQKNFPYPFSKSISRRHAELFFGPNGEIGVTDLGSTNGTRLHIGEVQSESTSKVYDLDGDTIDRRRPVRKAAPRVGKIASREAKKAPGLEIGMAEQKLRGEDAILIDTRNALFGVFDGVGGEVNGDVASRAAARTIGESMQSSIQPGAKLKDLRMALTNAFYEANDAVMAEAKGGGTTGVVAMLHEDAGRRYAIWASAGDSRMYVYNDTQGRLTQVTQDEALPNGQTLRNALGLEMMTLTQTGILELADGDKVILCSDGITGDKGTDILEAHEIATAMRLNHGNQDAAQELLRISRKRDDKSVLVVS